MTGPAVVAVEVKSGRRAADWHVLPKSGKSIFYYLLGMLVDENGKPSMSRWMFAIWTYVGWVMIRHELLLKPGDVSISNAAWGAWWAAEGAISLAVFGPRIASYFGAGAAGAVAGIGSSIRDAVATIVTKVDSINAAPAATQVNVNQPAAPAPVPDAETPVPSREG
ncbi:MAG TPA: hypothetical protein VGQ44_17325 [Gemmatimonadaceae bacterium]|jgi:hypothetical protein|nr:hypothetical protein [Gemmatimonadaceae bacterium]